MGSGCSKRDFSETGCTCLGDISVQLDKRGGSGVQTPRTPPVAPALILYIKNARIVFVRID